MQCNFRSTSLPEPLSVASVSRLIQCLVFYCWQHITSKTSPLLITTGNYRSQSLAPAWIIFYHHSNSHSTCSNSERWLTQAARNKKLLDLGLLKPSTCCLRDSLKLVWNESYKKSFAAPPLNLETHPDFWLEWTFGALLGESYCFLSSKCIWRGNENCVYANMLYIYTVLCEPYKASASISA